MKKSLFKTTTKLFEMYMIKINYLLKVNNSGGFSAPLAVVQIKFMNPVQFFFFLDNIGSYSTALGNTGGIDPFNTEEKTKQNQTLLRKMFSFGVGSVT